MGDQVGGHASTWKGWAGFAVGLLIGAAIGIALIVAAPAVIGIATACVLASAVTGAVALAATGAMVVGRFAHTFDAPAVKGGSPCSVIVKGLDTVKIESFQAARQSDPVSHGTAQMRQGSATVLMRKLPASRVDDLSSCTGKVIKPATHTFIGGPPADNGTSSSASAFDDALGAAAWTAKWFGLASMALGVAGGALAGAFVVTAAKMAAIWAGSTLVLTPTLAKLGDMQDRAEGHGGHEPVQSLGATIEDNAVDQWDGLKGFFGADADAKARAAKSAADARADAGDPAAHRWKDFDSGMSSFITVALVEGFGKMFGKSPAKTGEELAGSSVKPTTPEAPPPDAQVTPPEEECTTCKGGGETPKVEDPPPPPPEDPPPPVEDPPPPAKDPPPAEDPPPPAEDPPPPAKEPTVEEPPKPEDQVSPEEEETPQETEEEKTAREAKETQQYADGDKFFQNSLKNNPPKSPEAQAIADKIANGELRVQLLDSDSDTEGGFSPPSDPNEVPTIQIRNQGRTPSSQRGTTESMYHEGTHYQQWVKAGKPPPGEFYEYYKQNFAPMEVEAEVTAKNASRSGPPTDELIARVKADFLESYIDQFGDPPPGYRESNAIWPEEPPKCPTCDGADEAPPASEIINRLKGGEEGPPLHPDEAQLEAMKDTLSEKDYEKAQRELANIRTAQKKFGMPDDATPDEVVHEAYDRLKVENKANYDAVQNGADHPSGVSAERLKLAVEGGDDGVRVPLTYKGNGDVNDLAGSRAQLDEFSDGLGDIFDKNGVTDAQVVQVGSGTTGWKNNPIKYINYQAEGAEGSTWFNDGAWKPSSDTDLAVFSAQAGQSAADANVPVNEQYGIYKTGEPGVKPGFSNTPLGEDLYNYGQTWDGKAYTPEVLAASKEQLFDFKLNVANDAFTTPPTVYKGAGR